MLGQPVGEPHASWPRGPDPHTRPSFSVRPYPSPSPEAQMPKHGNSISTPSSELPFAQHGQSKHSKCRVPPHPNYPSAGYPPIPITQAWPSHHSLRSPGPHGLGASPVGVGWLVLPVEAVVGPERAELGSRGAQAANCTCDPSRTLQSLDEASVPHTSF